MKKASPLAFRAVHFPSASYRTRRLMVRCLPGWLRANTLSAGLSSTLLLSVCLVSGRSAPAVIAEQAPSQPEHFPEGVALPASGQPIERELSGGQRHSYPITLA